MATNFVTKKDGSCCRIACTAMPYVHIKISPEASTELQLPLRMSACCSKNYLQV